MALALLTPVTEAAAFTIGCAIIHLQQRHAERLTGILVVMGWLLLLGIAFVLTPAEALNAAAMAALGETLPLQPE